MMFISTGLRQVAQDAWPLSRMHHTEQDIPRNAELGCSHWWRNLKKAKLEWLARVSEPDMQVALRIQTLRTKEEKVPGPHARPTMTS